MAWIKVGVHWHVWGNYLGQQQQQKKKQQQLIMDFENGVIVKIYKSKVDPILNGGALAPAPN